jgi:hypothetical protein
MLMPTAFFTFLLVISAAMSSVPSMPAAAHPRGVHPDEETQHNDPKPVIL